LSFRNNALVPLSRPAGPASGKNRTDGREKKGKHFFFEKKKLKTLFMLSRVP
jgi:hypothetical protein